MSRLKTQLCDYCSEFCHFKASKLCPAVGGASHQRGSTTRWGTWLQACPCNHGRDRGNQRGYWGRLGQRPVNYTQAEEDNKVDEIFNIECR
ncbi:hypothetical protein DPMN_045607 [Dreissena polymorpha]|uniref:Uncharacterized protein n=1 Tax=Dreissena polymorpha TaxID=45954 RepID=A0A9D4D839_DREPO|nr:hypothetical protein DPMN_045607 [Dreissena polymorpha]